MRIGVPREIKDHEFRVGLTPAGARALAVAGHEVRVQSAAGERQPQFALRLRQMRELAIFPVIAEGVQAEVTAATAALREWPVHPATPLLLRLCDVLLAQVAGLRPAGQ